MPAGLLRLGVRLCKCTIQMYVRRVHPPRRRRQTWSAFLRNHGTHIWACDFLQTYDLFFRHLRSVMHRRCRCDLH